MAPVQARPAASHSRARGGEPPPQPLSGQEAWQVPPGEGPTAKFWLGDIFRLEDGELGGVPPGRGDDTRTFAPLQCPIHPRGWGRSNRAHCHPRLQALPGGWGHSVGGVGGAPPPSHVAASRWAQQRRPAVAHTGRVRPHAAWLGAAPPAPCHHPVTTLSPPTPPSLCPCSLPRMLTLAPLSPLPSEPAVVPYSGPFR